MKKPLNMIENPAYPDIKKGPPRFVWSKKHWTADPGATMRDTEPFTQFYENAVLVQSRDYNKTTYGQSSHKDNVNSEFRPPIQSPYEDFGPITRIPCTIHAIVPHINPGTSGHDGGTNSYASKNQRPSDIEGALTDRLKDASWRPTFYAPMDAPIDNSVLPDLEVTMPNISVQSGWSIPYNSGLSGVEGVNQAIPLREQIYSPPLIAGTTTSLQVDGQNANIENFELINNHPNYSIGAGSNTPFEMLNYDENVTLRQTGPRTNGEAGIVSGVLFDGYVERPRTLPDNAPKYSLTAGSSTGFTADFTSPNPELTYNRPQYAASAGTNVPFTKDAIDQSTEMVLEYNGPKVPITAGTYTTITFDAETPTYNLQSKLSNNLISVINPGMDAGYGDHTSQPQTMENIIRQNKPAYSYQVPSEVPTYRTRNERSHAKHFQEKLQAQKSYGAISQSAGYIPRFGLDMPPKGFSTTSKMVKKMGYDKPKVHYKI